MIAGSFFLFIFNNRLRILSLRVVVVRFSVYTDKNSGDNDDSMQLERQSVSRGTVGFRNDELGTLMPTI